MCDIWNRYFGSHVTPEEYKSVSGDIKSRIKADLNDLWGSHPTDKLNQEEINQIADDIVTIYYDEEII